MVYIGAAYAAGLFFASSFQPSSVWLLLVMAACSLILLALQQKLLWRAAVVLFLSFALGLGWYHGYTALHYTPVLQYAGTETTFTGKVTAQTIYDNDRAAYQLDGAFPDGTAAKLLCYTDDLGCRYGDLLTVEGMVEIPEDQYVFSAQSYYQAKGIFLQAANDAVVTLTQTEGYILRRTLQTERETMQNRLLWAAGTENGGIMTAMLFGEKQFLSDTVKSAFLSSGIGHVISVSGFHMVILLIPLGFLGKKRLFRMVRFVCTIVLVGLFTLLTEAPISVLRAGFMVVLAQSAALFYRQSNTLNALAIAFLLLTLPQPYLICDASFLLSFSGTFGIGVFAPYLTANLHPVTAIGRLGKSFLQMLLVFLCVLPVSAMFFSEISLLSPITNVLLIPLCSAILICTLLTVLFGGTGFLAECFLTIGGWFCDLLTEAVIWVEQSVPLMLSVPEEMVIAFLLAAFLVILCFLCFRERMVLCSVLCGQMVLLTAALLLNRYEQYNRFQITILGRKTEAAVVVQYHNQVDIIDLTGHYKNPQYVKQYLEKNGIRRIASLTILDAVPHMYAAYDSLLSAWRADAVIIPEDGLIRETDVICGQHPQKAAHYTIQESQYTIQWNGEILQIFYAGRTVTIGQETIAEALETDVSLLPLAEQWCFVEQHGSMLTVLCYDDDVQLELMEDGTINAGRI